MWALGRGPSPSSRCRRRGRAGRRSAARIRRLPRPLPADRGDRGDGARADGLAAIAWRCPRRRGWRTRPMRASVAESFVRGLAATGRRRRSCSGRISSAAQEALFSAAEAVGLRVASGLVVSDRGLFPELEVSPAAAVASSRGADRALARARSAALRGHAAVLGLVLRGAAVGVRGAGARGSRRAGHEPPERDARRDRAGAELFPWASRLPGDVRALRPGGRALGVRPRRSRRASRAAPAWRAPRRPWRTARRATRSSGAGCSRCARHLDAGVRVALGTDVGAGTGLSMLKEG